MAFDLKAFFMATGKDPVEVTAAEVFEFLAHQRGDRRVVRLADRESGLSARTIARRRSSKRPGRSHCLRMRHRRGQRGVVQLCPGQRAEDTSLGDLEQFS